MQFEPIPEEIERIGSEVVDAAVTVHKALGPGLLEPVYEACLCHEFSRRGIPFETQKYLPIVYRELRLETGLRLDLLVADCVIIELKAVQQLIPLFDAQLLTYLKLTNKRLGFLLNFNVPLMKDGIKRIVR